MKVLRVILALTIIMSVMSMCAVNTFALKEGDWEFKILDNQVTITKYIGSGGKVTIPEMIAGCPVTAIGEKRDTKYYADSVFDDSGVTELIVNAKITEVPVYFASSEDTIKKITLPEGVEVIRDAAFRGCESLESINIPSTVKIIEPEAFKWCYALESIILPEGIECIGNSCFESSGLVEIDLSNLKRRYQERNERGTFANCKQLKKAVLSPNIENVHYQMFINCTALTDVIIPAGVKSIDESAFEDCTALESIILPSTLEYIGWSSFNGTGLKEVVVPYGTKELSISCFADCKNLEAVYVPDTVTDIKINPVAQSENAIIYCSADSYTAQYCREKEISYLTDNSVNSGIHVYYNGKRISFHSYGQNPEILEGRTLVPLRSIFEAMGAKVEWNGDTKTATAKRGNVTVEITIGANEIYKNGKAIAVDVPAQIVNDRTMVPARVIAEAFGATVEWNANGRTVLITE